MVDRGGAFRFEQAEGLAHALEGGDEVFALVSLEVARVQHAEELQSVAQVLAGRFGALPTGAPPPIESAPPLAAPASIDGGATFLRRAAHIVSTWGGPAVDTRSPVGDQSHRVTRLTPASRAGCIGTRILWNVGLFGSARNAGGSGVSEIDTRAAIPHFSEAVS